MSVTQYGNVTDEYCADFTARKYRADERRRGGEGLRRAQPRHLGAALPLAGHHADNLARYLQELTLSGIKGDGWQDLSQDAFCHGE